MTKKRDPSLPRRKPGPKPKMDHDALPTWHAYLTRTLVQATGNLNTVKKNTCYTLKEIRARWGIAAVLQFKQWFESRRHYDNEVADIIRKELETGKIDQAKYERLLYTKAFRYVWFVRDGMERKAWDVTRGLKRVTDV